MPKWMKPEEEMPGDKEPIYAGDRILLIVVERPDYGTIRGNRRPRLVILEATEDGWDSPDPVYVGYTPEDGVLWSSEKDVCGIAHALELV